MYNRIEYRRRCSRTESSTSMSFTVVLEYIHAVIDLVIQLSKAIRLLFNRCLRVRNLLEYREVR